VAHSLGACHNQSLAGGVSIAGALLRPAVHSIMFTGIIEETGRVVRASQRNDVLTVRVAAKATLVGLAIGGSIAVNGCCLTVVRRDAEGFECDLMGETLARTGFSERLQPGATVNLERPMRADGRFDGHIVQGHVDGVGRLRAVRRLTESAEIDIEIPGALERYLVEKGSVAVDGISLTIARLDSGYFTVALIPHTLDVTNLGTAQVGDKVNLEADVVAKHVERLLNWRER
jgi:riboflavin synthase